MSTRASLREVGDPPRGFARMPYPTARCVNGSLLANAIESAVFAPAGRVGARLRIFLGAALRCRGKNNASTSPSGGLPIPRPRCREHRRQQVTPVFARSGRLGEPVAGPNGRAPPLRPRPSVPLRKVVKSRDNECSEERNGTRRTAGAGASLMSFDGWRWKPPLPRQAVWRRMGAVRATGGRPQATAIDGPD
jgi:hypothetical protein